MGSATPLDLSGIDFALKVWEEWKPADDDNVIFWGGVQGHPFAVGVCSIFAKRIAHCGSVYFWNY
jgi:hypothetical protein